MKYSILIAFSWKDFFLTVTLFVALAFDDQIATDKESEKQISLKLSTLKVKKQEELYLGTILG